MGSRLPSLGRRRRGGGAGGGELDSRSALEEEGGGEREKIVHRMDSKIGLLPLPPTPLSIVCFWLTCSNSNGHDGVDRFFERREGKAGERESDEKEEARGVLLEARREKREAVVK